MPDGINRQAEPSGDRCAQCEQISGWWVHLRRCAECGNIGCCDSSPGKHATAHFAETGHPIMTSFEPGEEWFWDYRTGTFTDPAALAPPLSHPAEQPAPGPAGRVPDDWQKAARMA
jgi:hypothetical protein